MPAGGESNHNSGAVDILEQKTAELRSRLSNFAAGTTLINSTLKDVHQLQSELDVELKPLSLVKGRLDRAYDVVGEQTIDEIKCVVVLLLLPERLEVNALAPPKQANRSRFGNSRDSVKAFKLGTELYGCSDAIAADGRAGRS